ncbi:MAG: hypothetical protein JSU74_07595 [Candidatus Zixiibacteriota bacterium]|nr:MAG: hypothetical protein JSU74_07595 [candidate division Zixibacteria bacterium]
MAKSTQFDTITAHQHFSQQCFNQAWDLMEKPDRTDLEDQQMIQLNQASIWHWTQRDDCTPQHLSVGFWQTSRIYSLLEQPDNAVRYGQLSLDYGARTTPFYRGYAYEALARAEQLAGNRDRMNEYLKKAREAAEAVTNAEEKEMLLSDLASIK